MVRYKIRGPTNHVTFAALTAPPDVRRLGPGKVLGEEDYRDRPEDEESSLRQAEQVLVDIVAGCLDPEAARPDLQPYVAWLQAHSLIGRDLETRLPAFFAWLRAKAAAR
jgi:hypothetical protein